MKKNTKQIIALAISVVMIIGMFPMIALAEWVKDENTPPVELPEGQTPVENDENARWEVVGETYEDGDVVIGHKDGEIIDTVQEYVYQDVTDENGETVQERVRENVRDEYVFVVDEDGNVVNDEDGQPKRAQEHKRVTDDDELEEGQVRNDNGYVFTQETVFVYVEDEDGNVMLDENDQPIRVQVPTGRYEQIVGPAPDDTPRINPNCSGNSGSHNGTPANGYKIGADDELVSAAEKRHEFLTFYNPNGNHFEINVPAEIIVTIRVENSNGYRLIDISDTDGMLRIEGNNWWIYGVRSNLVNDYDNPIYGDLTRVVDHPVMIDSMREVWDYKMQDRNIYEQLEIFNQIRIQIFQRFLWVQPTGDGDPPIIEEDDPIIFYDTETGEILTLEEVVALFVPTEEADEEETVEIATPEVPLAPAPAEVADEEEFVDIAAPAVPLAAPEAGPHIWLLTLLIFPLLVIGWIIRQKTKKEESYE